MKKCFNCGIEKELTEFHYNNIRNNYVSSCKLCKSEYSKKRYLKLKQIRDINNANTYKYKLDELTSSGEWKSINNYSNYLVSNTGVIISKHIAHIPKILTPSIREGYLRVWLINDDGKSSQVNVHKLVLDAFNPITDISLVINHIDGNKSNNSITNLEWCTYSQNLQHAYDIEIKTGKNEPYEYYEIYDMITRLFNRESYSNISADYDCSVGYLSILANRKIQKEIWIDFLSNIIDELSLV